MEVIDCIVAEVYSVYKKTPLQSANLEMSKALNELSDKQTPKLKLWERLVIADKVRAKILDAKKF